MMLPFNKVIKDKIGKFPIGVWVPYYKEDLSADYLSAMRECGINFVPSITCGKDELKLISDAGMKILVNDDRLTYCNVTGIVNVRKWIAEYIDEKDVIGVFVWDEPSPTMMRICGAINKTLQEYYPNTFGFTNLHPDYSDKKEQRDGRSYEEYLDFFLKNCEPKVVCYDNYPFFRDGFHSGSFFSNMAAIAACAKKNRSPFWTFIQSSSFGDNVRPNEAQLKFQVYASLAYGAQGILYFTYKEVTHEKNFGAGFIDKFGNRTEIYDYATEINKKIQSFGDKLLASEHKGVSGTGDYEFITDTDKIPYFGENIVAGLFDGEDGEYCFVVNGDFTKGTTIRYKGSEIVLSAGDGVLIKL